MFHRLFLLSILLLVPACGATLVQKLDAVGTAVDRMTPMVIARWNADCMEKATTCVKTGVKTAAECQPLQTCQKNRRIFAASVASCQSALAVGLPLAAQGSDATAKSYLTAALLALAEAQRIAGAYGMLSANALPAEADAVLGIPIPAIPVAASDTVAAPAPAHAPTAAGAKP